MAFAAAYPSVEDAPEFLREHLKPAGDVFVVDVTPVDYDAGGGLTGTWSLEDAVGLKKELQKLRDTDKRQRRELKELAAKLPEEFDAEEWQRERDELVRLRDETTSAEEKLKANHEGAIRQLKDRHDAALREKDDWANSRVDVARRSLVKAAAMSALGTHKANVDFTLHHVMSHLECIEEDGELRVRVVDDDGTTLVSRTGTAPMAPDEFVAAMKVTDRWAPAFPADGTTGSGAGSGGAPAAGSTTAREKQRLAAIEDPVQRLAEARAAATNGGR